MNLRTSALHLALPMWTLLSGCNGSAVPVVDPQKIVVGQEEMSPRQFIDRYCKAEPTDKTCLAVQNQIQLDRIKRKPTKEF